MRLATSCQFGDPKSPGLAVGEVELSPLGERFGGHQFPNLGHDLQCVAAGFPGA